MEGTTLPKCVMFGELVGGVGCVGGQEKEWLGSVLEDLRAFGINAYPCMAAAQDTNHHNRMAQDGGTRCGTFHGEMDRCRESQG